MEQGGLKRLVEIIRCEKDTYWYKDNIGDEFFVEESQDDLKRHLWRVVGKEHSGCYIVKTDCEVLPVSTLKINF